MDTAALLKQLSQTPGLSGHETEIRSVVLQEWGRWAAETRVDKMGNALAICRGTDREAAPRRSIMLATHMDEIGLMVAGVKHGFIHVVALGGVDARILPGQEVIVHGRRDLPGLVASTPPHLLESRRAQQGHSRSINCGSMWACPRGKWSSWCASAI